MPTYDVLWILLQMIRMSADDFCWTVHKKSQTVFIDTRLTTNLRRRGTMTPQKDLIDIYIYIQIPFQTKCHWSHAKKENRREIEETTKFMRTWASKTRPYPWLPIVNRVFSAGVMLMALRIKINYCLWDSLREVSYKTWSKTAAQD